jgi:hypothetical protein
LQNQESGDWRNQAWRVEKGGWKESFASKSVGNTGSQITKTRTSWLFISRSNCPVAEAPAPCKQTAQVGEITHAEIIATVHL